MGVSTLIIGLGQIGMGYDLNLDSAKYVYSHSRAFSLHPYFELVGGIDQSVGQRQIFETTYLCPSFSSLENAHTKINPQCIIIATPTQFHCETLLKVTELFQPKTILCEKPLSYSISDSRKMIKVCEAKDIELYVNYMRISEPGVIEIKRRLSANEIQHPLRGLVWYSKGFLHNGSHFFNLVQYWLGGVIGSDLIQSGRDLLEGDAEPDVHVRFEFGDVIFMAAKEENFSHYTVELLAPNGRLRYESGGREIIWQKARQNKDLKGYSFLSEELESISSGLDRYQWHVADALSQSMRGSEAPLCTGKQALNTTEQMQIILGKR